MFPKELQLTSVKAVAKIVDEIASVRLEQTYYNTTDSPVEGLYQFPVFANAVITGCRFVLPDETVTCVVEDCSRAERVYDEAVDSGKQAVMAVKLSDELYELNVGGIPPNAELRVELAYATLLKQDAVDRSSGSTTYRLTIPTTIADWRYHSQFDIETPKPTFSGGDGAPKLSIEVILESSCTIKRMKCLDNEPCELSFDGPSGQVKFEQDSLKMTRDFVFVYSACGATCIVEPSEAGEYAMLVNAPVLFKPTTAARPGTYVFIVDQSGSMGSTSFNSGRRDASPIEQARNAAALMVKSLNAQCKFNVYGFGNSYYSVFDEPVSYTEDTCRKATAHCKAMNANMGGTELRAVVSDVLSRLPDGECFVFLMTDCGVYDIDGIKGIVRDRKRSKSDFCLSVLSIGDNVGYDLSEGLARFSGGLSKSVLPNEDIARTTMELFNGTLNFAGLDVSVDFGAGPRALDLQLDTAYYDFIPPTSAESCTILVTRSDGLVETTTVPIKYVAQGPKGQDLHCVVADAKIRRSVVREDSVALSKRYGVMSKYTSFVGVSDADLEIVGGRESRERKKIVIPLQHSTSPTVGALIVSGGCGIGGNLLVGGATSFTNANAAFSPATFGAATLTKTTYSTAGTFTALNASSLTACSGGTGMSSYSTGDMVVNRGLSKKMMKRSSGRSRGLECESVRRSGNADKLTVGDLSALLSLQKFSGAFDLDDVTDYVDVPENLRDFVDDPAVRDIIATLVVIDILNRKNDADVYRFVFEKAKAFVQGNLSDGKLKTIAGPYMSAQEA
jgi:hypothetical protein